MGSCSARPPDGIPTARQPAVGVMVMEQDHPPPLILVYRHRTDGVNGLPCRDDSSLDRMQTAGALLDRPLQHMQVTSGRGVAWHTTSTANTVYDPD
eukprot:3376764-Rhodomonas_salina.1